MKQREKCSGRGCESPQVHHITHYCIKPAQSSECRQTISAYMMGLHSFDRAKSNRVDSFAPKQTPDEFADTIDREFAKTLARNARKKF